MDPRQWTCEIIPGWHHRVRVVPMGVTTTGEPIVEVTADGITLRVTQAVYERLNPWGVAHLACELEVLPSLLRLLTLAVREDLPVQPEQTLEGFLREYGQYGEDLLARFLPHFTAVLSQGKPPQAALKRFELAETGMMQPKQRRPRGRPPKGLNTMSNAERQRAWRDRQRAERERSQEVEP